METTSLNGSKKTYRVAIMIGFAMIGTLLVYAILVEFIKRGHQGFRDFSPFPELEILRYFFFALTIAEFFLIRWIRRLILFREDPMRRGPQGPGAFSSGIQRLLILSIITYAFCESIAIFGLILFLMGGNSLDFYFFAGLSLMFYFIFFPRYYQWEEYLSQLNKMGETP